MWYRCTPPVCGDAGRSDRRIVLQDARVPKLFLRVTSTGVCSWSVQARLPNGRRIRPTLGHWPYLGISAARKAAVIAVGEIAAGVNPTDRKRAMRRAWQKGRAD